MIPPTESWTTDDGPMIGRVWRQAWRFPNHWGVSAVQGNPPTFYCTPGEGGTFEVAICHWHDDDHPWCVDYSTPITDDVLGHVTPTRLAEIVDEVASWPPPTLHPWEVCPDATHNLLASFRDAAKDLRPDD